MNQNEEFKSTAIEMMTPTYSHSDNQISITFLFRSSLLFISFFILLTVEKHAMDYPHLGKACLRDAVPLKQSEHTDCLSVIFHSACGLSGLVL